LKQADVEVDFELTSIDNADPFDPSWLLDVEKHCREAGASVQGGIGPFGLVVLASDNMEEHTAVHFRVYKSQQSYMILMCSDLRRSVHMVFVLIFLSQKSPNIYRCLKTKKETLPFFAQVFPKIRPVHPSLWRLL
jgi:hypothetical protein